MQSPAPARARRVPRAVLTIALSGLLACAQPVDSPKGDEPAPLDSGITSADGGGGADSDPPDTAPDSDPPDTAIPDTGGDTAGDTGEPTDPYAGDSDGDGLSDREEGRAETPEATVDFDGDGTPDYLDLDSDDDGVSDELEGAPRESDGGPADTDGDGVTDVHDDDSDNDGISDLVEAAPLDAGAPEDTDLDGTADYRDEDTDGDGMTDAREGVEDWDGDGLENWRDVRNDAGTPTVSFVAISTSFNSPIGIDFHESSGTVVMSVNYPTGNPTTLEQVAADGSHATFSAMSGLTDEVKIATARSDNPAGFNRGELFVGNGLDGQVVKISADGATITNPWVTLPGFNNGLMRGSLYVDRTGVWGGDLIVVTTYGEVWRIDAAANPTQVAKVAGVHLEGLITVPDSPERFGPLAGCIIAGAEEVGLLYAFDTTGAYTTYSLGVNVEDIDIVEPNENFFGVNYGTSRLVGVDGDELLSIAGDVLFTMESVSRVGLYHLTWDGATFSLTELGAASGSASLGQWEHVTFAHAGIQEIPA